MYSFYGGRPGNSFIIITTYRSIKQMTDAFKQGSAYTVVHYDEHVMINTDNKNDPDNGKIFRRGYDFNNDMGGAEYIGSIVGPAGRAPMMTMTTEHYIDQLIEEPSQVDPSVEIEEYRSGSGEYKVANESLVPGKDGDGNFHDSITWKYLAIRKPNGEDTDFYIGFTAPYTIFEWESQTVAPYNGGGIERIDNGEHPFYQKLRVNIPHGIKGDSISEIKVETANNNIEYVDRQKQNDDVDKQKKIFTYTKYNYDNKAAGQAKKYYLGEYNVVDNVEVDDEGTLLVKLTNNEPIKFQKKIKWIDDISLGPIEGDQSSSDGTFLIKFNNSEEYQAVLKWIKNLVIDENNGKITAQYSDNTQNEIGRIKMIDRMVINKETGQIGIVYNDDLNNPELTDAYVKWINNVQLESNGSLIINYNQGEPTVCSNQIMWLDTFSIGEDGRIHIQFNNKNTPEQTPTIRWIESISLDNTIGDTSGQIKVVYNTRNADNGIRDEVTLGPIKWPVEITTVTQDSGGQPTKLLRVNWNNDTYDILNNPINDILDMAINNSNNHLLVRYSDPAKRDPETTVEWNSVAGWTDLGNVSNIGYEGTDQIDNIDWCGIGVLKNTSQEVGATKTLKFTLTPTQLLSSDILMISALAGYLTAIYRDNSSSIYIYEDITTLEPQITKTFSGIQFSILTDIPIDNIDTEFVDILIEGLDLKLITELSEIQP